MLFADLLGKYVLVMSKNYLQARALDSHCAGKRGRGTF